MIVVDVWDCEGSVDFRAEVCILDVKKFTASSISVVVFKRTFQLVLCSIDFYKSWCENVTVLNYIGWIEADSLLRVEWRNDLSMGCDWIGTAKPCHYDFVSKTSIKYPSSTYLLVHYAFNSCR